MTYKNMISGVVGREAKKWLDSFLITDGAFTTIDKVEMKMENGDCYYKAQLTVYGLKVPMNQYTVGGTADNDGRVYNSVIYDWNGKILWMSVESTRKIMGITAETFEI